MYKLSNILNRCYFIFKRLVSNMIYIEFRDFYYYCTESNYKE